MKVRVLVVSEDEAERLRATTALRDRRDVEITEVSSVLEAHGRTEEEQFDILVFDGDMRPEGGFSLLYEIRARAELKGEGVPPAIMLIGREDDRWLALRWAGAMEALVKPVNSFVLAKRVEAIVRETGGLVPAAPIGETAVGPLAMDEPPDIARDEAPGGPPSELP
ncbi:MAG: response regulator [Nitriliruptorales bacterium]